MSQPVDLSLLSLYLWIDDRRTPGQKYLDPDFERYRSAFETRMHQHGDEFFGVGNNTHSDGGVGLIGRRADYVVRNTETQPMLWYRRRLPLEGDNRKRLQTALREALTMAADLAADARLEGKVTFPAERLRLFVDRSREAPNSDEGFRNLLAELSPTISGLYGPGVRAERIPVGGRLGVEITGPAPMTVKELLEKVEKL